MNKQKLSLTWILSLKPKGNKLQQKAFTLVELIVVITILAILSTIAFIALWWMQAKSRDSIRKADFQVIRKALEITKIELWYYPEPTWPTTIVSYSWAEVWTQGTFWDETRRVAWWLPKAILDPLTNWEYTYSLLNTNYEYELWTILEWSTSYNQNILNQTNAAATEIAISYTAWDYNGMMAKTSTWWTDYILAVPTIITSNTTELDVISQITNHYLAFKWFTNLPASYSWTQFKIDADPTLVVSQPTEIVVFSWDLADLKTSDTSWETTRQTLVENLQLAYTGTNISYNSTISSLLTVDPATATEFNAAIVNNNLWWSVVVEEVTSASIPDWTVIDPNCDISNITIWTQTWAWCNTTLWDWIEYTSDVYCYDYNWVNLWTLWYCHAWFYWDSTDKESDYYTAYWANINWDTWVANIWWKMYTWYLAWDASNLDDNNDGVIDATEDDEVCWVWYHIPSDVEWEYAEEYLYDQANPETAPNNCRTANGRECDWQWWKNHTWDTGNLVEKLQIPLAGYRSTDGSTFLYRGLTTGLWSSTSDGVNMYYMDFSRTYSAVYRTSISQAYGFFIRCIKD